MRFNRRRFLKVAATGAGTVAVGSHAQSPVSTRLPDERPHPSGVKGYGYQLPSFPTGSRLVFLGDSITDMNWGRNEKDRNHYLGHSYVYLIAARLGVDMPEVELDFYNRGISGNTVDDLQARWQKDAVDMKPDLLSILIGVNHVSRGGGTGSYEGTYRRILGKSREANAELRLVLLDPFVLPSGRLKDEEQWKKWREEIDKMSGIVERLATEFDAVHVKTQEIFDVAAARVSPEHWLWDGVHPLPQGHELIARNWLQEVSSRWPR
ncbi:MAG: twin-arginine translocation signal domain-containing protein [Verrucomicrobiae bacterium]|nr:twin-arginine translocation signal domain-containing protein [Verrucomicrobiae bacterium]